MLSGYKELYEQYKTEEAIKQEVDQMFEAADIDENGEIDFTEWQVASINKFSVLTDSKLKTAF